VKEEGGVKEEEDEEKEGELGVGGVGGKGGRRRGAQERVKKEKEKITGQIRFDVRKRAVL